MRGALLQMKTYSTNHVAAITRVTLRQLQWWDEMGLVCPGRESRGHKRVYTVEDVREIMLIAALRRRAVSLQAIRRIMTPLRKYLPQRLQDANGAGVLVVTDGRTVYVEVNPARVIEILVNARKPYYVVPVEQDVKHAKGKR